jgi:hypothetical protein
MGLDDLRVEWYAKTKGGPGENPEITGYADIV